MMVFMARKVAFYLLCSCAVWLTVAGQSPGDHDQVCKDMSATPDYAQNIKALMDSWGYNNLLDSNGGPWTVLDKDNDSNTWSVLDDEQCRVKLTSNEPISVPQDNWIITQYINKTIMSQSYDTLVYVNVSYILDTVCEPVTCLPHFQLRLFLTNDPTDNGRLDTTSYTLLANITGNSGIDTFSFTVTSQKAGFFLGVVDQGANVTLSRVLVYRVIGPAMQVNLTLFPESPAPISSEVEIEGTCAANANVTSGMAPMLTLSPGGSWTDSQQCYCIEGHELTIISVEGLTEKACEACSPGTYKSGIGNGDCQVCPDQSSTSAHGSVMCDCDSGYYRAPDEGPEVACTGPPSAPRGLDVPVRTSTTATIQWEAPDEDGGRSDSYYNVLTSLLTEPEYTQVNGLPITDTTYTLTSLTPNTIYRLRVTSNNGVSDQDPNSNARVISTIFQTLAGVPPMVGEVVVSSGMVEWAAVDDSLGTVEGYDIQFVSDIDTSARIIYFDDDILVYSPNITEDYPPTGQPVYVRVRGRTSAGPGEWSTNKLFAEVNPIAPIVTTSSSVSSASAISSTSNNGATTTSTISSTPSNSPPTNPPSEGTSGNAALSIGLSLAAVVGIIVVVVIIALGFFTFRKVRDKYCMPPSGEDTDGLVGAVKYSELRTEIDGDESEGGTVYNPGADDE